MQTGRQVGTLANAVFIKETEKSGMCVARSCKYAGKSAMWQNAVHIRYKLKNVLRNCRQDGKITRKAYILQVCRQVSKSSGKTYILYIQGYLTGSAGMQASW